MEKSRYEHFIHSFTIHPDILRLLAAEEIQRSPPKIEERPNDRSRSL